VPELPTLPGKPGGRTLCRRIPWPKPVLARVAGQDIEPVEPDFFLPVQSSTLNVGR
jgi:hypothetical protein